MLSASVTLVAGDYRSSPQRLRSVAANAPLIRVPASALYAGDTVTLSGEHLQRITRLSLGSQRLPFSLLGDGLLSLTLPALPAGDVLHWQDDQGNRYSAALPVLRAATVTLDMSLGEGWQGAVGDVLLSAGAAQTVWVPAGMPQTVVMVHRDRPVAVQGLIWPDQPGVVLGAHSTLQHWLWRQPRLSSSAGPQWPSVRARLDAVASSAPALHDDLTQALQGDSAALLRVQQGFSEVADAAVASPAPATAGLVQARSSWAQDMLDAIMAGGSLYVRSPWHRERITWQPWHDVASDAVRGLEYLHMDAGPPIIHQDVKSEKFLLGEYNGQLVAMIADFCAVRIALSLLVNNERRRRRNTRPR